jgi:nucleotide-binding universal stress UspA family protein
VKNAEGARDVVMKHILLAVDGSTAALHAGRCAVDLAKSTGGAVSLIHVTPPTVLAGDLPLGPVSQLRAAELASGAAVLAEAAQSLGLETAERINLLGAPAEGIADTAEARPFDVVVVGNKGRGAVARMFLGSVADRLVHICKVPVLVVR